MSEQNTRPAQLVVASNETTRRRNRGAVSVSARMGLAAFLLVVEALYQSADAFPPLKSAVGGIMAILTLYEVCNCIPFSHFIILTPKQRAFVETARMQGS